MNLLGMFVVTRAGSQIVNCPSEPVHLVHVSRAVVGVSDATRMALALQGSLI